MQNRHHLSYILSLYLVSRIVVETTNFANIVLLSTSRSEAILLSRTTNRSGSENISIFKIKVSPEN